MTDLLTRPLLGPYPYVWLDATCLKRRKASRVTSVAAVVGIGVTAKGEREVLGLDIGSAAGAAFLTGFLRDLVTQRGLSGVELVAAAIRTIFAAGDIEEARSELKLIADGLARKYPETGALLLDSEDDVIAHMAFPREHWNEISSINPLEHANKEIERRTNVVGIFPNRASTLRLTGAVLLELNDE